MKFKQLPKSIRAAALTAAVSAVFAVLAIPAILFLPHSVPAPGGAEVRFERGARTRRIASELKSQGVISGERSFRIAAELMGASRHLQAGRYRFEGRLSNWQVIRRIRDGRTADVTVTFPEGITAVHVAGTLAREFGVDSAACMALILDPGYCRSLGVQAVSLEGYLYPDTYRFPSESSPESMIGKMVSRFNEEFSDSLRMRAGLSGFTVHQIVTLASIIEGEAVLDAERSVVSAVYHNRLRKGMALQACPTIQYLLPDGPRRLLNRDLTIVSPYNTYLHPGLPPGPVNNPGRKSILAALYPSPAGYLYMVANGDGSHTFSSSLEEHNSAKRRFNQYRKSVHTRPAGGARGPGPETSRN
jgi:UPF0755 protein